MNFRIYKRNVVGGAGSFPPKNGGASAPPIDEDPRFPLVASLANPSRFRSYRTSSSPANPIDLDWDFGSNLLSFKSVGLANIRAYRGTAGVSSLEVFYSTTAYPPSAWPSLTNWTQILAPQSIGATVNDVIFDLPSVTLARCWRLRIANAGQFSCRPWIVFTSDVIDFNEGFGVEEAIRRIRAPEAKTLLGGVLFNDLGVGKAAAIRGWKFQDTMTTAQRDTIIGVQSQSLMMRDAYGGHYEVTPSSPRVGWSVSGVLISTRSEVEIELEQLP